MYCEVSTRKAAKTRRRNLWQKFAEKAPIRVQQGAGAAAAAVARGGVESPTARHRIYTAHPMQKNRPFSIRSVPSRRGGRERPNTNIPYIIHYLVAYVNTLSAVLQMFVKTDGFCLRRIGADRHNDAESTDPSVLRQSGVSQQQPKQSDPPAAAEESRPEPESTPPKSRAMGGLGLGRTGIRAGRSVLQNTVGFKEHICLVHRDARIPPHDEVGLFEHTAVPRSYDDHILFGAPEHVPTSCTRAGRAFHRGEYSRAGSGLIKERAVR